MVLRVSLTAGTWIETARYDIAIKRVRIEQIPAMVVRDCFAPRGLRLICERQEFARVEHLELPEYFVLVHRED